MTPRRTIRVGNEEQEVRSCCTGMVEMGVPGSGKSVLTQITLKDLIFRLDSGIVLDVSGEELGKVEWMASLAPGQSVNVFDPHMTDSCGIDFPKVVRSETGRWRFASKIFPEVKNDPQPYFNLTAREIFFVALCVLCFYIESWDFADVINLASEANFLSSLADQIPNLGDSVKKLGNGKSANDVLSTVRMRISPLRTTEALLRLTTKKLDLHNLTDVTVLVGRQPDAPAWSKLFSYFLDTVFEERLIWSRDDIFFRSIDQGRQLQRLDCISAVIRLGRKCGVIPILTLHELSGWLDQYGELEGCEIINLFGRMVFLWQGSVESARFASERRGSPEGFRDIQPPPGEKGVRREFGERPNVTIDELRRLHLPDPARDRFVGYYEGPNDVYRFEMPFVKEVSAPAGWKPSVRTRRPEADEILHRFKPDDFKRLNFPKDPKLTEFL